MTSRVQQWIEEQVPDFNNSAASLKTGISVSNIRRHLGELTKTQSVHETIVAVCRAYNLPVIEGLIQAGLINREDAASYKAKLTLAELADQDMLYELIRRIQSGPAEELRRPITSDDIDGALGKNPDYSAMTEDEAAKYGLAAHKGEQHIAIDDLPHEP